MRRLKKSMFRSGIIILSLMILLFSNQNTVKVKALSNPIRITCVGASDTAGNQNYPVYLQELLGPGYTVINCGINGATMLKKGDFPYWNQQQYMDSTNSNPDIVIIMLGSNDAKPQNWVYKGEYISNYKEMIDHFRNLPSHPTVYLNTLLSVYNEGNYGITEPVVTGEVVPLVKQIGFETGCRINDVNAATKNMPQNFPDNVHPNTEGAKVVARTVFNGLTLSGTNAFLQMEAEKYNIAKGTVHAETCGEGGQDLGYISTGDCAAYYKVDFGSGAGQFQARISGVSTSGKIHIKLDNINNPDIGVINGTDTGSWQTYTTESCNIGNVTGVHDVYLVFDAGINLNWFKFASSAASDPTFYQDTGFGGTSRALAAGNYTTAQLAAAGIPDNWASSVKVPGGYTVEIYDNDNFGGTKWTFTSDNSDFVAAGCNDRMSSVRIIAPGGTESKYEAESGTLANGAAVANDSAASGGSCIQNMHNANASCQIGNVGGGSGGGKTLRIAYASNEASTITVYVNGTSAGTISCPATGGWSTFTGSVQKAIVLNSGTGNTIRMVGGSGGINLDYITIRM